MDIYSLTEENPWRIELWGDEVDSIRSFDAESQRSLDNLEEIMIYPAAEKTLDKGMVSFLDYFPEEEALIFLDEPNRLTENGQALLIFLWICMGAFYQLFDSFTSYVRSS